MTQHRRVSPAVSALALAFGAMLLMSPALGADTTADAKAVVKKMADYMAAQTDLHFAYDSDLDVVTDDMQKVTFASSGEATISRPGKINITRHGGYTDLALVSDGKTVTLSGNRAGIYAQTAAPATLGELVDKLDDTGIQSPAADLLSEDAYASLTDHVTDGKVIGTGYVGGKECTHVAFRTASVDWQLWVMTGDKPLPCQYMITTKHVAQAPQYSIRFSDWSTGVAPAADAFAFTPPSGSKEVKLEAMSGIDELPDADEGDKS